MAAAPGDDTEGGGGGEGGAIPPLAPGANGNGIAPSWADVTVPLADVIAPGNGADRERAFQLVHADDAQGLAGELDGHQPEAWSIWRNLAGRTLYQVAEREGRGHCLELLRERLRALGLVPVEAPRVDYIDRTVVAPVEVSEEIVPVTVPEIHYHKTLRHVPEFIVKEVPEVVEVPRRTVREELRVVEERVSRPRHVTQTTICEEPEIRRVQKREETLEERPLPIELTPVERTAVIHKVDVVPDLRPVPKVEVIRDYEEVPFLHNVYVPKTEVKFVDQVEVRQREITVPNVTEHPVIVEKIQVERKNVTMTDTEIIRNIIYVPQMPMQTEWVPQCRRAAVYEPIAERKLGGNTTNASPGVGDLWYELNLLRSRNDHLVRMNARLKGGLDKCGEQKRQLGDQLARERQLRLDKERQVQQLEREVATVTYLKTLPPQVLGSPGADCFQSPNQSTTFISPRGADRFQSPDQSTTFSFQSRISERSPFRTPLRQPQRNTGMFGTPQSVPVSERHSLS